MVFTIKTKKGNYHPTSLTWVIIPVVALIVAIGVSVYAWIKQAKYREYYQKTYDAIVSGKSSVTLKESKLATQAVRRCAFSTPELFIIDSFGSMTRDGKTVYTFARNGYASNYEYHLARYNAAIEEIAAKAPKFASDKEAVKWIHDYIIENYEYDYSYTSYSALSMIDTGSGVCNAYTSLFGALAGRFGIEYGVKSNGIHTWNVVKLGWKWYHVDVTWDDTGDVPKYDYFLKDDAYMRTVPDHLTWEDTGVSLTQYENRRNTLFIFSGLFFLIVTALSGIPMVYAYFKE